MTLSISIARLYGNLRRMAVGVLPLFRYTDSRYDVLFVDYDPSLNLLYKLHGDLGNRLAIVSSPCAGIAASVYVALSRAGQFEAGVFDGELFEDTLMLIRYFNDVFAKYALYGVAENPLASTPKGYLDRYAKILSKALETARLQIEDNEDVKDGNTSVDGYILGDQSLMLLMASSAGLNSSRIIDLPLVSVLLSHTANLVACLLLLSKHGAVDGDSFRPRISKVVNEATHIVDIVAKSYRSLGVGCLPTAVLESSVASPMLEKLGNSSGSSAGGGCRVGAGAFFLGSMAASLAMLKKFVDELEVGDVSDSLEASFEGLHGVVGALEQRLHNSAVFLGDNLERLARLYTAVDGVAEAGATLYPALVEESYLLGAIYLVGFARRAMGRGGVGLPDSVLTKYAATVVQLYPFYIGNRKQLFDVWRAPPHAILVRHDKGSTVVEGAHGWLFDQDLAPPSLLLPPYYGRLLYEAVGPGELSPVDAALSLVVAASQLCSSLNIVVGSAYRFERLRIEEFSVSGARLGRITGKMGAIAESTRGLVAILPTLSMQFNQVFSILGLLSRNMRKAARDRMPFNPLSSGVIEAVFGEVPAFPIDSDVDDVIYSLQPRDTCLQASRAYLVVPLSTMSQG